MTKWYVKDLSRLTSVSVQTLHHYDRIGLLKPSIRLTNNYRVYSEADLLKLQQIIALKFFGFELSQIKTLLVGNVDTLEHFKSQAQFLEEKAKTYATASQTLKTIMGDVTQDKSIPWKTILKTIEVYHMTQNLQHAWVKEIFTPEELKQYATFEIELKSTSNKNQKAAFEKNWQNLVKEIQSNLQQDPNSEIGARLGKKCMELIDGLYGRKYAHLRTKLWEKGFGEGKGHQDIGVTQEIVDWLDVATLSYWRQRFHDLFARVGKTSSAELMTLWNDLLDDMYGEDLERKEASKVTILTMTLLDDKVSQEAKNWLKQICKQ